MRLYTNLSLLVFECLLMSYLHALLLSIALQFECVAQQVVHLEVAALEAWETRGNQIVITGVLFI